ncbi:MAG: glycosyltransferase [Deltaproteobacteria bacterium]|nr:glycosyltransferase [Deltaproteobacteria bacterium]
MKLGVVIPTKDRPEELRTILRSIRAQSAHPAEIWVVDSSSDPVTGVVDEFGDIRVRYLRHAFPSASAQRNAGVRALSSEVELVAFFDDDITLEPGAISAVYEYWASAPKDVAGCTLNWVNFEQTPAQALKRSRFVEWLGMYSGRPGAVMPSGWHTPIGRVSENRFVDWIPSLASVWRRQVLMTFGFEERFEGYSYLEDLDFSLSVREANHRLAVLADAGFLHLNSPKGRVSFLRFGQSEVENRVFIVRKHRLSMSRCLLGLTGRLLATTVSGVLGRERRLLDRVLGNCVGLVRVALDS